jgi:hypothetical protein
MELLQQHSPSFSRRDYLCTLRTTAALSLKKDCADESLRAVPPVGEEEELCIRRSAEHQWFKSPIQLTGEQLVGPIEKLTEANYDVEFSPSALIIG